MSHVVGPRPSRIIQAGDVPTRLKELGMTIEMLQRSIEAGDSKRRLVSQPIYPATYRGIVMWAETLAELRRQLLKIRDGWEIGSTANYATVYCAERNMAIAVAAGDASVGKLGHEPRLTRKKGDKTTQRVQRNARLMYIQEGLFTREQLHLPPDETCQTWFLLLHPTTKEIRIELSCPVSLDDDGIVGGWLERILVPAISASGAIAPIDPDDDDDGDDGDNSLVGR